MIQFRCRKHRDTIQRLWQVAKTDEGTLAARPLEGVMKTGLRPGGWVPEARDLVPGLYCQACLQEGANEPLPDYDELDISDAGLVETPHIGLTASDFDLSTVWPELREHFASMVVVEDDRDESPAIMDGNYKTDARLLPDLRDAVARLLKGGDLYRHQATAIDRRSAGETLRSKPRRPVAKVFVTGCQWPIHSCTSRKLQLSIYHR